MTTAKEGSKIKINPKSDSHYFALNRNENIRFVQSLKSDLRVAKLTKSSCCRSFISASALTFVTGAPSRTACLLSANVGGHMLQTQESCWRDGFFWKAFCLSSFLQHLTCALNTPARRNFSLSLRPSAKHWVPFNWWGGVNADL